MTGADAVLAECLLLGVGLRADGGRLVWRAPRGVMTDALRAALAAHRDPLLARLGPGPAAPVPDVPDDRPPAATDQGPNGPNKPLTKLAPIQELKEQTPPPTPVQVPDVPDVPDPGGWTSRNAGSTPIREGDPPDAVIREVPPKSSGTSGTSGTDLPKSQYDQRLGEVGDQGLGAPPTGTSGTGAAATGAAPAGAVSQPDEVWYDPPAWRVDVARWPHGRWAAWRAASTADLARLGRPPTATEVRADDERVSHAVLQTTAADHPRG
jgi:hypothetical protein